MSLILVVLGGILCRLPCAGRKRPYLGTTFTRIITEFHRDSRTIAISGRSPAFTFSSAKLRTNFFIATLPLSFSFLCSFGKSAALNHIWWRCRHLKNEEEHADPAPTQLITCKSSGFYREPNLSGLSGQTQTLVLFLLICRICCRFLRRPLMCYF